MTIISNISLLTVNFPVFTSNANIPLVSLLHTMLNTSRPFSLSSKSDAVTDKATSPVATVSKTSVTKGDENPNRGTLSLTSEIRIVTIWAVVSSKGDGALSVARMVTW